jgi:membrane-associated PAP2 superfamily phosphatase
VTPVRVSSRTLAQRGSLSPEALRVRSNSTATEEASVRQSRWLIIVVAFALLLWILVRTRHWLSFR